MAQTDTWLDGSGNWDDPTKWSQGKKPSYITSNVTTFDTGPENAVIGGSATETITVSGDETGANNGVRSLTLNNYNASLVITGALEVGVVGGADAACYLNVQNGSLIVDGGSLTVDPGSIPSNAPTLQQLTSASGTVYLQNYGSYNWNSPGSAAGQTIAFQGSGNVVLNSAYNGKIVGFGSGDSVVIYGNYGNYYNIKSVTYSGNLSNNQATITYNDNTTSTLQFSVNTNLNITVTGGAAYIYGVADQAPAQQPYFQLQGLDGDGYANAQQPLSFYYTTGGTQLTFTYSENVGGQAIILQKGGEDASAYTPTAADAGQEIDISVSYYDLKGVYQTRTFYADVNSLPPVITAPGTVTNKAKPTISGTGEIGASVALTIDGKVIDTSSKPIIVKNDGTWSYTPPTALGDGNHNVSATQQGVANASDPSDTDYFAVDTTPPTIASVTLDKSAYGVGDTVKATIQLAGTYDNHGDYAIVAGSTIDGVTLPAGTYTIVGNYLTASFVVDSATTKVSNAPLATHIIVDDAVGNASALYTTPTANTTIGVTTPTVTPVKIHLTGATGTGGAFKIGDTVTATWDNTSNGDNNSAVITDVTVDFSQFGGGTAVTAVNSNGTWTATYTIVSGSTQASNRNVAVTATDSAGPTTTSGTDDVTVDNQPPSVVSINTTGTSPNNAASESFTVTFSEGVSGVDAADFNSITTSGTAASTGITVTSSSASVYNVTVNGVTGDGTLRLDLNSTGTSIADLHGNPIRGGFTAGQTYTIDTTAPNLSIDPVAGDNVVNKAETQNQVVISGTTDAETGQTVTILLVSGNTTLDTLTTTVQANGTWTASLSPQQAQALADGSYTLKADVSDRAGNPATEATRALTVDTKAPTITIDTPVAGDGIINASEAAAGVVVTGTTGGAEDGQTVTIRLVDSTMAVAATDAGTVSSGVWSATITAAQAQNLADGAYTLKADVSDAGGNPATSATQVISVDETAPAAPSGLANASVVNGYVNAANDTATQAFTGTAEAGSTVTVYDGATKLGTTTAPKTGGFSYTLGTLADGSHSLTATATDAAGNTGTASTALSFVVDATSPKATAGGSVSGVTNRTSDTISGMVSDANGVASVHVFDGMLDLGAAAIVNGSYSLIASGLTEGTHSFTVTARDNAGNSATTKAGSVTVDMTPPALTAGESVSGLTNRTSDTISGTVSDANGIASVHVFDGQTDLGAATISNGSYSLTATGLSDGAHSFSATAIDNAGNSTTVAAGSVRVDASTAKPVITSGVGNDRSRFRTISGTAEANATVTLMDYNVRTHELSVLGQVTTDASGHWTDRIAFASRGAHAVEATAIDAAGNSATSDPKIYGFGRASYSFFVQAMAADNPQGVGFFAPSPNAQTQEHPLAAPHGSRA